MEYRTDRSGTKLSVLGYGCMRLTKDGKAIDLDKAERELLAAYRSGVNYFDTAYIYPGSEEALGQILARNHLREQVYVATKLPQYLIRSESGLEKYFSEQLARLQTDYIDYYLMHHLTDVTMWQKLKDLGIERWIAEKKAAGAIRSIGFSFHGDTAHFLEILNDYDWDFCQIQYNYLDEDTQAGRAGLKAAAARGIPVIIMEPLRGGKLVDLLPTGAKQILAQSPRGWTPAQWAFRWLYDQPEVTVVLSGMNSLAMVEENCRTASEARAGDLTEADRAVLAAVKDEILRSEKVGCTGCRYCMPCPKGVDIPGIFRCYNAMYTESKSQGRFQFAQTVGLTREPAFADQCVGCGACERHCPQGLPIRAALKEADRALRPPHYKLAIGLARRLLLRRPAKQSRAEQGRGEQRR